MHVKKKIEKKNNLASVIFLIIFCAEMCGIGNQTCESAFAGKASRGVLFQIYPKFSSVKRVPPLGYKMFWLHLMYCIISNTIGDVTRLGTRWLLLIGSK